MTTVSHVLTLLEAFAPTCWALQVHPGDNVGLLVGRRDNAVTNLLVALDVTEPVIREAMQIGAELIVTHHPIIYRDGLKFISDASHTGRLLLELMENRIAAICMHTNWDAAPGGINDLLARAVGLEGPLSFLGPVFTSSDGRRYGLGRVGQLPEPVSADRLAQSVKDALGCRHLRYADGGRLCHTVAVGSGNSCSQWDDVRRHGCDAFITGDVSYHLFLEAQHEGITLIDAGHYPTEQIIVAPIAALLRRELPGVGITASRVGEEPFDYEDGPRTRIPHPEQRGPGYAT